MSQHAAAGWETTPGAESVSLRSLWYAARWQLLAVAAFLPILAGIFVQGPEYDESIVMLTVSGHTAPVWPEEPVAARQIQGMFADRTDLATLLADIRNTDVHPPLHYVAAWLMHLVTGPSLAAQRLLSLAALAGCLFLLLRQWRRDMGEDLPSTAVFILLFTLAPASYFAGSTARGYAFIFLFLTVAYVALRRLAGDGVAEPASRNAGPAAVIGIGTGLAILTHYLAAVPAIVLGVSALTLLARQRDWRGLLVLCATAVVPALVSGAFLVNQLDTRGGYDPVVFPGFVPLAGKMTVSLFLQVPNEFMPIPSGTYLMLLTAIATAFTLFAAAVAALRKGDLLTLQLPIAIITLHVAGLVLLQWSSGAPLSAPRYLAIIWPFAALVLAHGVMWYCRRFRWGMGVAALLIGAYLMQVGLALGSKPGHPFKDIAEAANGRPGKAIIMVDRGYGRGVPASITLAASPATRIWVVTPEILEAAPTPAFFDDIDEIHVALSAEAPSREHISRWLDRLPSHTPYVERDTDIYLHRYFTRRPAAN